MGEKARKFTTLGAYDAAHASLASMGVHRLARGYEAAVQVVAETIFGGTPEAAMERYAKQIGSTPFEVWLNIRECLDNSKVQDDVLDVVRKSVQLSLDGCQDHPESGPIPGYNATLEEVEELRQELRRLLKEGEAE